MLITLTSAELMSAAMTGAMRRISSLQNNYDRIGYYPAKGTEWASDIDGAAAELAVAKCLNKHWGAHVGHGKSPDVDRYQVRSTNHENGKLIFRKGDLPDEIFILVVVNTPNYWIAGYIDGVDAMSDEYLKRDDAKPSWWVPQEKLNDIKHLMDPM